MPYLRKSGSKFLPGSEGSGQAADRIFRTRRFVSEEFNKNEKRRSGVFRDVLYL